MVTKAMCPKCGNSLVVTAAGTLRSHGSCGNVPVEKALGTLELKSKAKAQTKKAPAKKAAAKKTTKKATARRK